MTLEIIIIFIAVVSLAIWLDLWLHRNHTEVTFQDAIIWSIFWISLALSFAAYLNFRFGGNYAQLFLSGYILEKALSIDNLMVFIAIFTSFKIGTKEQHRILYYGIIGAMVFRLVFVALGSALFSITSWIQIIFALIIAWTGWKMLTMVEDEDEGEKDYSNHWAVKLTQRFIPIYPRLMGSRFFVSESEVAKEREKGFNFEITTHKAAFYVTPVFLCLIIIEISDVVFAFDSVPAIIVITQDPVLVYSAVIFALLGLRSLYFLLAAAQKYLVYLDKSVALLLFFIAGKLLLQAGNHIFHWWPDVDHIIPINMSLFIILSILMIGVLASLICKQEEEN